MTGPPFFLFGEINAAARDVNSPQRNMLIEKPGVG